MISYLQRLFRIDKPTARIRTYINNTLQKEIAYHVESANKARLEGRPNDLHLHTALRDRLSTIVTELNDVIR